MTLVDWIQVAGAVGTLAMAVVTAYLAYYTHQLAKDTADGIKQADRHHRENLRPFCVIDFEESDIRKPFGRSFHNSQALGEMYTSSKSSGQDIILKGKLANKGKGPAKDILLFLNTCLGAGDENVFRLTKPMAVSGLIGAEETVEINVRITEDNIVSLEGREATRRACDLGQIPKQTYQVVLRYKDIFDTSFFTVHPRRTRPGSEADPEWTTQGKPTPIFQTERQVDRTLAEFPGVDSAILNSFSNPEAPAFGSG